MQRTTNLSSRDKIVVARSLNLLLESEPINDYEKVPVINEMRRLIYEAVRECIKKGRTPDCAVDGEGGVSPDINTINEFEFRDLILKLQEIEDGKTG
jgi:hypothetical protein